MPLPLIPLAIGAVALGGGLKLAGDGIEDAGKGIKDVVIVAAVVYGSYLVAKKQGLI